MTVHKEQILELSALGWTYSQIQAELGCSKGTIAYHLGKGQKEKTKARTNRNRTIKKRELWDYKESIGCVDCGEKYPHYMLEFDHLPVYDKIDSPTQIVHKYGIKKALEEVSKCDVVCANCHKIRSYLRGTTGHLDIPR